MRQVQGPLPDSSILGSAMDDVPAVLAQREGDFVGLEAGDSVGLVDPDAVSLVLLQELEPLFGVPDSGLERDQLVSSRNEMEIRNLGRAF